MQYPPFCDFVYILVSGEDEEDANAEIVNIGDFLKENQSENILKTMGPAPAGIKRIKNMYRFRIIMKVRNKELILPILRQVYEAHESSDIKNMLSIDINPTNMI